MEKIVSNVAPPEPIKRERREWPFKNMNVGDSVLFDDIKIALRAQVVCHLYGRQSDKKFATRKEGTGIRVWRIA